MTAFEIVPASFDAASVAREARRDHRLRNWPVVYTLDSDRPGKRRVYVGQTNSVVSRMPQHFKVRPHMESIHVLLHEEFNRSVALDLEAWLIARFQGDPEIRVENAVTGEQGNDYFDHERYRAMFPDAFAKLRDAGLFSLDLDGIENTEFFKLSPFKTLTEEQELAVQEVLDGFFEGLRTGSGSSFLIEGEPGTGKTIVAITILKQIVDVARFNPADDDEQGERIAEHRSAIFRALLPKDLKIGFVVPQQALRETIQRVFEKTSGLSGSMVLTPYDVANSPDSFDLLVVDEAHRLEQPGNHGTQNKRYEDAGRAACGEGGEASTMLDWIIAKSQSRVLLADVQQSIRPVDLPADALTKLRDTGRSHVLRSQLRVRAGDVYLSYVRDLLRGVATEPANIRSDYDFRLYDDPLAMYEAIQARNREVGLARMLAGFAWDWPKATRNDPDAVHVVVGDLALPWNRAQKDWVNSAGAIGEVGCIHTIQGYDLNYAAVIIGPDLKMDPETGQVRFDWDAYRDPRKERGSRKRGIAAHSDEDLLEDIVNIYYVLMTRGILGTYVYVVDPVLREYLRQFIPAAVPESADI